MTSSLGTEVLLLQSLWVHFAGRGTCGIWLTKGTCGGEEICGERLRGWGEVVGGRIWLVGNKCVGERNGWCEKAG